MQANLSATLSSTPGPAWRAADFGGSTPTMGFATHADGDRHKESAERPWAVALSEPMRAEIDRNVQRLLAAGFDWRNIDTTSFPLEASQSLLSVVRRQIEQGCGFAVITGLPIPEGADADSPDAASQTAINLAYGGLCSHLGVITAQTHRNDLMIEVTDIGQPYDHTSRGYSSNKALPFHTDGADVAALLCLSNSAEGGQSVLVSALAVFDCIKQERPELLPILMQGFYHHRRGEQPEGESPLSSRPVPVFSFHDQLLHCMYNRNPIQWAEKEGIQLTPAQYEALDFFDAVCARDDMQLHMAMRAGDIQLVNNFTILHSRTAYRDSRQQRRHLKRLWLSLPDAIRKGPTLLDLYAPNASKFETTS